MSWRARKPAECHAGEDRPPRWPPEEPPAGGGRALFTPPPPWGESPCAERRRSPFTLAPIFSFPQSCVFTCVLLRLCARELRELRRVIAPQTTLSAAHC